MDPFFGGGKIISKQQMYGNFGGIYPQKCVVLVGPMGFITRFFEVISLGVDEFLMVDLISDG